MNTRSLTFRLVAWYAGLLSLVFVALGALILMLLQESLERALLDAQARRAAQIAATLLPQGGEIGAPALRSEIDRLYAPEVNDRFIRISGPDGRLIYRSGAPHDDSFDPARVAPLPRTSIAPPTGAVSPALRRIDLGRDRLLVATTLWPGTSNPQVEVGVSNRSAAATVRQTFLLLAASLPLALLVAIGGGLMLVRRALMPVEGLSRRAEAISEQNLGERLPVAATGDELERLAQDRQFPAAGRETLGSLLEEVDRLGEVVESLLALSRLDSGDMAGTRVRIDLGALAAATAEQMSLLAEDRAIRLICEIGPGCLVEGNEARLKQVVVNLLDNAIKYTARGGTVRLRVQREVQEAVLEISDTGIGIPSAALDLVFERFYRVEDSRSRGPGGAGLGLSIVRSICHAHGGRIDVTSRPGEGSTFRVRQPLAPEPAAPAGAT